MKKSEITDIMLHNSGEKLYFATLEDARKFVGLSENENRDLIFKFADCPTTFITYWVDRFGWQMCFSTADYYNLETLRVTESEVAEQVFAGQGRVEYGKRSVEFWKGEQNE